MERMPAMRWAISRERSVAGQLAWMTGLILAPTIVRMLVDQGGMGVPFLTYWPSMLVASLLLDARYAIVFAGIAAFVAQRLFGGSPWFAEVNATRVGYFVLFTLSSALIVLMGNTLRRTVRMLDTLALQQEGFNRELRHRVRNMLAIIQALASRGPKAESPLDFFHEFSSRLEGLAKASDLLRIGTEVQGHLPDVIARTIEPINPDGRIHLAGAPCTLPNDSCIPLIMAVHELATNAVKHGALSNQTGRVDVNWFVAVDGRSLYILWKETGGPRVAPPERTGIGMRLLLPQPGLDAVETTFAPEGLWCEIMICGVKPHNRF